MITFKDKRLNELLAEFDAVCSKHEAVGADSRCIKDKLRDVVFATITDGEMTCKSSDWPLDLDRDDGNEHDKDRYKKASSELQAAAKKIHRHILTRGLIADLETYKDFCEVKEL